MRRLVLILCGLCSLIRLFFWSPRGQAVGVPNLLGLRRNDAEQVRDSDALFTEAPRASLIQGRSTPQSVLAERPWNIVLIVTDDQRWDTLCGVQVGRYGS